MNNKEILYLVIYPVKDILNNEKKAYQVFDLLEKSFDKLDIKDLTEAINIEKNKEELKEIADKVNQKDRLNIFNLSLQIVKLFDFTKVQLEKLAAIGRLLNIKVNDIGFSFNIYEKDELNDFEFKKTIRNFSLVSGAIGFIPFIPISDFTILTVINTGMVAKIANIYEYKLESKEFLKMISGVIGTGFVFRSMSKILYRIIPFFGWFINASFAYAGAYAIGILAKSYIAENGELSKDAIISIWERSLEDGKKEFNSLKDFIFEKKDELLKEFGKYKDKQKEKKEDNPEEKKSKAKSNKNPEVSPNTSI